MSTDAQGTLPPPSHVRRAPCRSASRGVTLLELVVTLALLAILTTVAGLTMHTAPRAPAIDGATAQVMAARDSALRNATPVSITLVVAGHAYDATAFPDGRVVTDAPVDIDPLDGQVRHDAR